MGLAKHGAGLLFLFTGVSTTLALEAAEGTIHNRVSGPDAQKKATKQVESHSKPLTQTLEREAMDLERDGRTTVDHDTNKAAAPAASTKCRNVILINSQQKSKAVYDRLLRSLDAAAWPPNDVLVVLGGSPEHRMERTKGGHHLLHVQHNSVDFTGLIAAASNVDSIQHEMGPIDSYLYLHDTTEAGPKFKSKLLEHDLCKPTTLTQIPSMNMGIYTQALLQQAKPSLLQIRSSDQPSFKELERSKRRGFWWEDKVYREGGFTERLTDKNGKIGPEKLKKQYKALARWPTGNYAKPKVIYEGSQALRKPLYYEDLDLWKYKANWHQGQLCNGKKMKDCEHPYEMQP